MIDMVIQNGCIKDPPNKRQYTHFMGKLIETLK